LYALQCIILWKEIYQTKHARDRKTIVWVREKTKVIGRVRKMEVALSRIQYNYWTLHITT